MRLLAHTLLAPLADGGKGGGMGGHDLRLTRGQNIGFGNIERGKCCRPAAIGDARRGQNRLGLGQQFVGIPFAAMALLSGMGDVFSSLARSEPASCPVSRARSASAWSRALRAASSSVAFNPTMTPAISSSSPGTSPASWRKWAISALSAHGAIIAWRAVKRSCHARGRR
jgi:hypothetical protein